VAAGILNLILTREGGRVVAMLGSNAGGGG